MPPSIMPDPAAWGHDYLAAFWVEYMRIVTEWDNKVVSAPSFQQWMNKVTNFQIQRNNETNMVEYFDHRLHQKEHEILMADIRANDAIENSNHLQLSLNTAERNYAGLRDQRDNALRASERAFQNYSEALKQSDEKDKTIARLNEQINNMQAVIDEMAATPNPVKPKRKRSHKEEVKDVSE